MGTVVTMCSLFLLLSILILHTSASEFEAEGGGPLFNISPIRHPVDNHNHNQVKYGVKSEPMQQQFYPPIKEETGIIPQLAEPKVNTEIINVFSPQPQHECCPVSPAPQHMNNNKQVKSPQRKKSTSSSNEEEDLLNVPSLQMRIQILQQRYGIPQDAPLELINGGHGIKNPMVADFRKRKR